MSNEKKSQEIMFSRIREWQGSGLSQKSFCEQFNIAYSNFHYWYKRFRNVDPPASGGFVSLQIQGDEHNIFASVTFSNGNKLQLFRAVNPGYIKELLS